MEFRILGPLEVLDQGSALPLGGTKQRAVLAILLLHANDLLSVDRIIDALWGEAPPDTARNVVQVYMSQLRKLLEPGVSTSDARTLITRQPGYLLRVDEDDFDLARVERLVAAGRRSLEEGDPSAASRRFGEALEPWRGEPLADFRLEQFAQNEIERLEELRLATREDLFEAELELGHGAQLVSELDATVHANPLRERLRAQLILALYQAGRQAEALDAYRSGAALLADELGIDPGPALRSLQESILRQDPALIPRRVAEAVGDRVYRQPGTHERATITAMAVRHGEDTASDASRFVATLVEKASGAVVDEKREVLVALFGFPHVREDAAQRAALLATRIAELGGGTRPAVGLASGRLPLSELEGDGGAVVIERAVKLASVTGGIVVDLETQRRIGSQFELRPTNEGWLLGTHRRLRGSNPDAPTSPLVGRAKEVSVLEDVLNDLERGRGRVLLIEGETGLGKTRILWELSLLCGDRVQWLQGTCGEPGGVGSFMPFARALQSGNVVDALGPSPDIGSHDRHDGSKAREPVRGPAEASFSPLSERGAQVDPQALVSTLSRFVGAPAGSRGTVIAIDDAHDVDADSKAVVEGLLPLTDSEPLCLVLTTRGEGGELGRDLLARAEAEYRHRIVRLRLEPLFADDAAALAEALAPIGVLDPATRDELVGRAEGNPLFLEQLVEALGASGGLERVQGWTLTLTRAGTLLPPALEDMLATRVQLLTPETRSVVQAAAVIGAEVSLSMLGAVSEAPSLEDAVAELLRAQVLVESGRIPEPAYRFRHGLLREATLTTLTPAKARELNRRAADALEALEYADRELIAYYRYRAEQWGEALDHLRSVAGPAEGTSPTHAAEVWELAARAAARIGRDEEAAELQERAAGLLSARRGANWHP